MIAYFTGVRASTYEEEFVVRPGIKTKNIFEAAGIQSPGLTAAPAIALDITKWILSNILILKALALVKIYRLILKDINLI